MNKYHNGKIYKIVDIGYNKQYIGSTTESLSHRIAKHRYTYKLYKEGRHNWMTCYKLFDEFGAENCKIELLEYCKCETKDELVRREGEYIKNNSCVNKQIAGRTSKEYYNDNIESIKTKQKEYNEIIKDTLQEYRKEYYIENKKEILEKCRERYSNNIDTIKDYKKAYHQNNKEKINARVKQHYESNKEHYKEYRRQWAVENKISIDCKCGCQCLKSGIRRHERTKKHQDYLKSLENQDE